MPPKISLKKSAGRRGKTVNKSQDGFISSVERIGDDLKLIFQGEEMDPSFLNALRRIMIGENTTLSLMGDFTIHQNGSKLNDEYIETRVKLMPIRDEMKDKIGDLVFWLSRDNDTKSPLINQDDRPLIVTSEMFQIYDSSGNRLDDKYQVTDFIPYNMPLLKLRKGEEIRLSVEVNSGIGRNHASWKSAGVTMKNENPVSLGEAKKTGPVSPITGERLETIEDKRSYRRNLFGNPENISLRISYNGHLRPDQVFLLTLDTLETKLNSFQLLLDPSAQNLQDDDTVTTIKVTPPSPEIPRKIEVTVKDPEETSNPLATHTIGNLLRNHMSYRLVRMTAIEPTEANPLGMNLEQIRQSISAHMIPHPLDPIMILKIRTPPEIGYSDDDGVEPSLKLLNDTIDDLLGYIKAIKKEFRQKLS